MMQREKDGGLYNRELIKALRDDRDAEQAFSSTCFLITCSHKMFAQHTSFQFIFKVDKVVGLSQVLKRQKGADK